MLVILGEHRGVAGPQPQRGLPLPFGGEPDRLGQLGELQMAGRAVHPPPLSTAVSWPWSPAVTTLASGPRRSQCRQIFHADHGRLVDQDQRSGSIGIGPRWPRPSSLWPRNFAVLYAGICAASARTLRAAWLGRRRLRRRGRRPATSARPAIVCVLPVPAGPTTGTPARARQRGVGWPHPGPCGHRWAAGRWLPGLAPGPRPRGPPGRSREAGPTAPRLGAGRSPGRGGPSFSSRDSCTWVAYRAVPGLV